MFHVEVHDFINLELSALGLHDLVLLSHVVVILNFDPFLLQLLLSTERRLSMPLFHLLDEVSLEVFVLSFPLKRLSLNGITLHGPFLFGVQSCQLLDSLVL